MLPRVEVCKARQRHKCVPALRLLRFVLFGAGHFRVAAFCGRVAIFSVDNSGSRLINLSAFKRMGKCRHCQKICWAGQTPGSRPTPIFPPADSHWREVDKFVNIVTGGRTHGVARPDMFTVLLLAKSCIPGTKALDTRPDALEITSRSQCRIVCISGTKLRKKPDMLRRAKEDFDGRQARFWERGVRHRHRWSRDEIALSLGEQPPL
jgi:hypothetical protein